MSCRFPRFIWHSCVSYRCRGGALASAPVPADRPHSAPFRPPHAALAVPTSRGAAATRCSNADPRACVQDWTGFCEKTCGFCRPLEETVVDLRHELKQDIPREAIAGRTMDVDEVEELYS